MSGIIDCEMHIGDEVFVHGYIDEIRNDTIIIRNVGGYFGTSRDEVFYYEEDDRGYGTMNEADRKTEPQTDCKDCKYAWWNSEAKRYECMVERCRYEDEPQTMYYPQVDGITPSVIEPQFDKDINVRSKDEPQTDCDGCQHYADKQTADACYECRRSYTDCYVPQTDCGRK